MHELPGSHICMLVKCAAHPMWTSRFTHACPSMQTHGADMGSKGLIGSAGLFFNQGRGLRGRGWVLEGEQGAGAGCWRGGHGLHLERAVGKIAADRHGFNWMGAVRKEALLYDW